APVDAVVAVVRPGDATLQSLLVEAGTMAVACARADDGIGASLVCGVRAVQQRFPKARGAVIALADMPWVAAATVQRVVAALRGGAALAAPVHGGRRGHPVAIDARFFAELETLSGDEGAKQLLAAHETQIERIVVDDPGVLRDVDTPADLR
ncbi:MAG: nucleotidyltransferase family protein, partial [Casimicrobiaceae bacterium]